jgi:hypothetical protein
MQAFDSVGSSDGNESPDLSDNEHMGEKSPIRVEEDFARPETSMELVASRV